MTADMGILTARANSWPRIEQTEDPFLGQPRQRPRKRSWLRFRRCRSPPPDPTAHRPLRGIVRPLSDNEGPWPPNPDTPDEGHDGHRRLRGDGSPVF